MRWKTHLKFSRDPKETASCSLDQSAATYVKAKWLQIEPDVDMGGKPE